MRRIRVTIGTAAALAVLLAAAPAGATGYWNVPSTVCQCMGVGWGAGYHAPLVLGPVTCHGWCDHKEVRLPHAPAPLCGGYDRCGCGCHSCQPSRLESVVTPPPAPKPVPVSAVFAPPFER